MKFEACWWCFSYRHHVVTFHVWFIFIFTLVVEFAEEVEGHNSVKVYYDSQESYSKHKLCMETWHESRFQFHSVRRDTPACFIALSTENLSHGTFPSKETKGSSYDSFEVSLWISAEVLLYPALTWKSKGKTVSKTWSCFHLSELYVYKLYIIEAMFPLYNLKVKF